MRHHAHADYAPPRSWDQFEELCADVFQSLWQDPGLVRYGRAGQRQCGVDIVARNGAIYPIGLQCKKRSQWPVKSLTIRDVDTDIRQALAFRPSLKTFYILTTAPADTSLLDHIREVNQKHLTQNLFEVVLLGWEEIVRRATLDPRVADKHFGPAGGDAHSSPLLATWMLSRGILEKTGEDLNISTYELVQDFNDWPSGHIVVRQREIDFLLEELRHFEGKPLSQNERKLRIKLREELHALVDAEEQAKRAITFMLTDPEVSVWLLKVWEQHAPVIIKSFINNQLQPSSTMHSAVGITLPLGLGSTHYLRMSPPGDQSWRCSASIRNDDVLSIYDLMNERKQKFGQPFTDTVDELPQDVLARIAIPRIIRSIIEFKHSSEFTREKARTKDLFSLGLWKIQIK